MSRAALVEAVGIGVRYGSVAALAEASIEVGRGEIWSIVGANGSGKSTLLRALAGLEPPQRLSGTVRIAGRRPDARARAFVPQHPEVAAAFSAREVVRLGRYAQGTDAAADERAVDRALREVGLAHRADRPHHELSGGERQRVAVARALAQLDAGGVILLDEPFSGVDPAEVARIARALRARAYDGSAVVLSLHDPGLARAIASHAAVLVAGRIVRQGCASEVLTAEVLTGAFRHPMRDLGGWIVPELGDGR